MASLTALPIDMLLPVMLAVIIRDDEVSVLGSIKALATVGRLLATSKVFGASTADGRVVEGLGKGGGGGGGVKGAGKGWE